MGEINCVRRLISPGRYRIRAGFLFGNPDLQFILQVFLQEEDGVAVIEIVLILLVLIALVVLFKTQITKTLKALMTRVTNDSSAI